MTARNPGVDPPPCNPKILKKGTHVALTSGASEDIEEWVREIAERSGQPVDWHFVGGRANVLALGDIDAVLKIVEKMPLNEYGAVPRYFRRPKWK